MNARIARLLMPLLVLVCVVLKNSDTAYSKPIYSQITPDDPGAAFSSEDTPTGQKVADNFALEGVGPVTVRSLRFIGGYALTSPPPGTPPLNSLPEDNFRIVFFENDAGSPGQPLANGDFDISSVFQRTATNGQLLNGIETPLEYKVNLGPGITLDSGIEYWVSIANDVRPDLFWTWARSSGLFDNNTASTFGAVENGPWSVFDNGGMFFELGDANIPEPNTASLIVIMLMSPSLMRSKASRQ